MMSQEPDGSYSQKLKEEDPRVDKGICLSNLSIGDDWGDNSCTMKCQLEKEHSNDELHREEYESQENGKVIVQWEKFGESYEERRLAQTDQEDWEMGI
jgi:hypothetical protein